MSNFITIKVKFENSPKTYELTLSENDSTQSLNSIQKIFLENIAIDYESAEYRSFCHIYNPETKQYVLNSSELKPYEIGTIFLMKNCSNEAKSVVSQLDLSNHEVKSLAFKLKNYLSVDLFAEEFISYEGIKKLIDIIEGSSGNTRSYAMNGFRSLLLYLNSMEYIRENWDVMAALYDILKNSDNINTIQYTLGIFILICDFLKEEGVRILYKSAEEYSKKYCSKLFKELVNFINDSSIDIKVNAITLICYLFKYINDKNLQAKILIAFQDVDLYKELEKNSDCRSQEFQIQLTNYQKLTGEIVRGSNYEIEIYKKKLRDIEKHCEELEKKVEFVFLNQKYYEDIVEDFVYFRKVYEVCSEVGGYYDPYATCERHDEKLNRNIKIDKNGILNIKKLSEEARQDDASKLKKLLREYEGLKNRYHSVKQDFELMALNNKELKNTIYELQENSQIQKLKNDGVELNLLKDENRQLMKKIEILAHRVSTLTQDLRKAEEDLRNKKEEIKIEEKVVLQEKIVYVEKEVIKVKEVPIIVPQNIIPEKKKDREVFQKTSIFNIHIEGCKIEKLNFVGVEKEKENIHIKNNEIKKEKEIPKMSFKIAECIPQNLNNSFSIIGKDKKVEKENAQSIVPSITNNKTSSIPNIPGVIPLVSKVPPITINSETNIPSIPLQIPQVPGKNNIPSITTVPISNNNIPKIPSVPGVPSITGVPKIPSVPGGVPSIPGIPSIPVSSIPVVPSITSIPGVPSITSIPGVPKASGVSGIPSIPGVPSTIPLIPGQRPPIPQIPGVPSVTAVPSIPIIAKGPPSVPGIPSIPGIQRPPVPSIPSMPLVPGVQQRMPCVPGAPVVPGAAPRLPGAPGIPRQGAPVPQINVPLKPIVSKQQIKLDKKVKPLHWTRVLILPKHIPRPNLVWNNVEEVNLDLSEVVSSFEVKASAAPQQVVKQSNENTKKKIFADKRAQSVGITIAKMPPIIKIEEALKIMDNNILSRSQINSLFREYITEEEIGEYESQNEPGAQWDKGEEFMMGLHKIPSSKLKLAVWGFTFEYTENSESLESTIKNIKGACEELQKNEILNKLLAYVLTIGNILNGGTPKGQADGFNLDILSKVNSIKDSSNKTMAQFICAKIKSEDENFCEVKKLFPYLNEAGKVSVSETQGNLNKLKKELKDNTTNLNKISQTCEDEFVKICEELFSKYSKQVENLEKDLSENIKLFQETAAYFGYAPTEPKYKNPEEFFNLMNDFINDVEKSMPKAEPKKVFKGKHEVGKKIVDNSKNMDAILKELKSKSNS